MKETTIHCEVRRAGSESREYVNAIQAGILMTVREIRKGDLGRDLECTLKNTAGQDFLGVIHLKLSAEQKDPKVFMPGYMYSRNTGEMPNHGRKDFPRIRFEDCGMSESTYWMTRSDRLTEPVSLLYDNDRILGISAPPYWVWKDGKKCPAVPGEAEPLCQFGGFTCHVQEDGKAGVGYTLGYENAPWLFIQTATVLEREEITEKNSFRLAAGEKVTFPVRIYEYAARGETDIYSVLRDVYKVCHQSPRRIDGMDQRKAVRILAEAVRDAAWLPEDGMYAGFVFDTPGGNTYNKLGSLSWTNGLAVAVPMLLAAHRLGDDCMRRQALTVVEDIIAHSKNSNSGLLYDGVSEGHWSVSGWWYDGMHIGGHSAYLNGQAVYYILKAFLSERENLGITHEDWLCFAKSVVDRLNAARNGEGEYPFILSEKSGAGLEYDSLGSCWCLAAAAMFLKVTGEKDGLESLCESEQHYYDSFVKKAECYGGPLDTDKAVDNEGILAYVRAVRLLHELTGEEKYLKHLMDGMEYELSFKLAYNPPVQVRPLSEIGWSGCGGSITSVANPHVHPMSSTVVDELIYLEKHTADPYIAERLKDTLLWGQQTFNSRDREYGYGKIGWMSERFCFCQGLVTEKYPDGTPASTWFALMPWASASIIEGFVGDAWNMDI